MTALAIEDDPYLLPMPAPDSPVVLPKWINPGNTHLISRYQEDLWSLAPLIDNPSTSLFTINWESCPGSPRAELKLIAWTMINGEQRPTYVKTRGISARGRKSADTRVGICREWLRLARWLHQRGVGELAACTEEEWRSYAAHRFKGGIGRGRAEAILRNLTELWAFDQIAARRCGIAQPPWETEGVDDYLPAAGGTGAGENSTEPLDPQVIGPLLVWAIRTVEDFADDILAAWAEHRRLHALAADFTGTTAGRQAALEAYLLPLMRDGSPIPATQIAGRTVLARRFIAATTGATVNQVDRFARLHDLTELAAKNPGPCPLSIPVSGQINGRPWREYLDYNETADLMRHLSTAAAITCLYLTGMRPQEVQGLRSGCCSDPAPNPDGSSGRHLIRSRHYKNVTDDDGNYVSVGEERPVPWVAITPVVHAIRALERMVPDGELLLSSAHQGGRAVKHPGALKVNALTKRIEDFASWANREALAHGLHEQVIPPDPHGRIGLARFRRTLAWHVARRRGGLIALAIQYGHMRTVLDARTSSGYAARSRRGIHSVLDVETALAAAETAAHLRDRIAAGEKISGPAARRAPTAAAQAPRFEGRVVPPTFAKKASAYLARDGLVLFDNPDVSLICVFKRDNALCDPGPDATAPNQPDRRPGCGNAVRTDSHARASRSHADRNDQLAAHTPGPIAKRIRAAAARDRATADAHDATAQPAEVLA
ncbi:integrase [Streptomyces olivaceoviridis]